MPSAIDCCSGLAVVCRCGEMERAYLKAQEQHGDLGLTFDSFQARLRVVVFRTEAAFMRMDQDSLLQEFYTSDLYVTWACAANTDRAWAYFAKVFRSCSAGVAYWICRSHDAATEVADQVLVDLYLPGRAGEQRVSLYDGRVPLAAWLRVIVANRARSERKRKDNNLEPLSSALKQPDRDAIAGIHAAINTKKYAPVIHRALAAATARLTSHERALLLWRYRDERRAADIARQLGINPSTICRQIAAIQMRFKREVVEILHSNCLSSQVEECLAEIASGKHSVLTLLEECEAGKDRASEALLNENSIYLART